VTTQRSIPYLSPGKRIVDDSGMLEPFFIQAWNDLVLRTGGQTTNAVSAATTAAQQANASSTAISAGVPTGYTISPTQPLSYSMVSLTLAQIAVAAHDRTESGSTTAIPAGTVTDSVAVGLTYYVYYSVPGTYLATTDASVVTASGSNKLINTIYVAPPESIYAETYQEPPFYLG
jgi:hypothetical protein